MYPTICLETERLVCRTPAKKDGPQWCEVRNENKQHLQPWEPVWQDEPLTLRSYQRQLDLYQDGLRRAYLFPFFLFHNHSQKLIGGLSFTHVRGGAGQSATLGYWLAAQHCRQGYMTEALQSVLHWFFARRGFRRVEAYVMDRNHASRSLLQRARFEFEGVTRHYLCVNGKWEDHQCWSLLAHEFFAGVFAGAQTRLGHASENKSDQPAASRPVSPGRTPFSEFF